MSNFDPKKIVRDYYEAFEYPEGFLRAVAKYCDKSVHFMQNGFLSAGDRDTLLTRFAAYDVRFRRPYAHEEFHILENVGNRVFLQRGERCYDKKSDDAPEENFYPVEEKAPQSFLSIMEVNDEGLITLIHDYFDISEMRMPVGAPDPVMEDTLADLKYHGVELSEGFDPNTAVMPGYTKGSHTYDS